MNQIIHELKRVHPQTHSGVYYANLCPRSALQCDHCPGIKRKITFVKWEMSSGKYIFQPAFGLSCVSRGGRDETALSLHFLSVMLAGYVRD